MTKDDIITMAREAGFTIGPATREIYSAPGGFRAELERFASLVASRVAAEEREACAKVLDHMADEMVREMEPSTAVALVQSKAASIRARGRHENATL